MGIALGLTNLLIRHMILKGWIKVIHIRRNRVRYLLTPRGVAAKARLSRKYFSTTLQLYVTARQRVRERFAELSAELGAAGRPKRILFFGAGEVAEIGYVSLQETDLQLTAVIDPVRTKPFFGVPVYPPEQLEAMMRDGHSSDTVVVMSFQSGGLRNRLSQLGIPPNQVFWI